MFEKSHLLGKDKKNKILKNIINLYHQKHQNINKILKQFSEQFINLKKSDLILFHENLLHRSNKNFTNKVRFAWNCKSSRKTNRVK